MKWLTSLVALIWLFRVAPAAPATSLTQVTDHLSVIARLVNGIALQNGFLANLTNFNDFIAELLDLESGDSVDKLMGIKIDVKKVNGHLDTILEGVKGLAKDPVDDSEKVKEAFQSLEGMKAKLDDLVKGTDVGLTKPYEEAAAKLTVGIPFDEKLFEVEPFEKAAEKLNAINTTPLDSKRSNLNIIEKAYLDIETVMKSLKSGLSLLKNGETELKKLFDLKGKSDLLKPVKTISEVAQAYEKSIDVFSAFPTTMENLKTESANLLLMANKHADFNSVRGFMTPIPPGLSAISALRSAERVLAIGFPNGGVDFETLFKDLKGAWIKNMIAEGRSVEKLEKALSIVQKWVPALVKMTATRLKRPNFANLDTLTMQIVEMFGKIAVEGETLSKSTDLTNSIDTLSKSIVSLKPTTGRPALKEFDTLYTHATDIDAKIQSLKTLFQDVHGKYDDSFPDLISKIVEEVDAIATDESVDSPVNCAKKIRALPKFKDLVDLVNVIFSRLKPFSGDTFVNLVKKPLNLASIKSVQESLQGTELVATLKRLKAQSYDSDGIDKMLSFRVNIRQVQAAADNISSVKSSLSVIDQLRKDVTEVKKVMSDGKTRRRRASSDSEALKKLGGSQTMASSIGRGVNLLRNLARAHEKKSQLIGAADSEADVNTAIATVPKASWTEDNRKGLKKMVDQLDGLEQYASESKDKNLLVLGSVLQKASEIKGVHIDTKILKKEVLPILESSQKQKIKNAVPVFRIISELELDFSKHSATLQGAVNSLTQARDFFDGFFGIKRSKDGSDDDDKDAMITLFIVVGCSVTAVLAVGSAAFISIFLCLKWRRSIALRKKLNDPESWNLLLFHHENVCNSKLQHVLKVHDYMQTGNFAAFRSAIKNGYYVDARTQSFENADTLLHAAVRYNRLKCAKYLIEHGADMWLKNHEYETPMMLAKKLNKKQFVALFKKYEKKKVYPKVLPEKLGKDMHRFEIDSDIDDRQFKKQKFLEKFHNHRATGRHETSHFIVVTDWDDCVEVQERLLKWVFSPTMLMSHRWMKACLDDPKNLVENKEWRVKGIKFKGEQYPTLFQIKDAINRRKVPYLFGSLIVTLDAVADWKELILTCEDFLYGKTFPSPVMNSGHATHPYYHDNLPFQLVVYKTEEGRRAAEPLLQQPDRFSVYSFDEFVSFLLNFDVHNKNVDALSTWVDPRIVHQQKVEEEKKKKKKKKKKKGTEMSSGMSGLSSGALSGMSKASTMSKGSSISKAFSISKASSMSKTSTPTKNSFSKTSPASL